MHLPTLVLFTRRKSWPTKEAVSLFLYKHEIFLYKNVSGRTKACVFHANKLFRF